MVFGPANIPTSPTGNFITRSASLGNSPHTMRRNRRHSLYNTRLCALAAVISSPGGTIPGWVGGILLGKCQNSRDFSQEISELVICGNTLFLISPFACKELFIKFDIGDARIRAVGGCGVASETTYWLYDGSWMYFVDHTGSEAKPRVYLGGRGTVDSNYYLRGGKLFYTAGDILGEGKAVSVSPREPTRFLAPFACFSSKSCSGDPLCVLSTADDKVYLVIGDSAKLIESLTRLSIIVERVILGLPECGPPLELSLTLGSRGSFTLSCLNLRCNGELHTYSISNGF